MRREGAYRQALGPSTIRQEPVRRRAPRSPLTPSSLRSSTRARTHHNYLRCTFSVSGTDAVQLTVITTTSISILPVSETWGRKRNRMLEHYRSRTLMAVQA
jgi:hypothetical protein